MRAPPSRPEASLRSFLFSPGSDERKLAKAAASDADAVIFDLEDSVAGSRKTEARGLVADEIRRSGAGRPVYVRVNAVATGLVEDDLEAVVIPGLAGIWLPMTESVDDVRRVDDMLGQIEAGRGVATRSVGLLLNLETARGVWLAYELATACERVCALGAGTAEAGDLHAELGGDWSDDAGTVPYVRARIVLAARAAGLSCIADGACSRLDDEVAAASARASRAAGFTAKKAIHPRHIDAIHRAFAPSEEEVRHAQSVVEAFAEAEAAGKAAISVSGRMIDYAMVVHARRVLEDARTGNPRGERDG